MTDPTLVQQVFDQVAADLLATGRVEVPGFGVFELYTRQARFARNPRTGARIDVPPKTVVRFRPASWLKSRAADASPPDE